MIVENNFISISSVVDKAMYTIHSNLVPFSQENFTLNFCWRSTGGLMYEKPECHVFIAHVPALYTGANDNRDSVSFESACLLGYLFEAQELLHTLTDERWNQSVW